MPPRASRTQTFLPHLHYTPPSEIRRVHGQLQEVSAFTFFWLSGTNERPSFDARTSLDQSIAGRSVTWRRAGGQPVLPRSPERSFEPGAKLAVKQTGSFDLDQVDWSYVLGYLQADPGFLRVGEVGQIKKSAIKHIRKQQIE